MAISTSNKHNNKIFKNVVQLQQTCSHRQVNRKKSPLQILCSILDSTEKEAADQHCTDPFNTNSPPDKLSCNSNRQTQYRSKVVNPEEMMDSIE